MHRSQYIKDFYDEYGRELYDDELSFQSFDVKEEKTSIVDEIFDDIEFEESLRNKRHGHRKTEHKD